MLFVEFGIAQENPTVYPYGGVPDESRKMSWIEKPPLNFKSVADFADATFDSLAYFREAAFHSLANFGGAFFLRRLVIVLGVGVMIIEKGIQKMNTLFPFGVRTSLRIWPASPNCRHSCMIRRKWSYLGSQILRIQCSGWWRTEMANTQ